VYGQINGHCIYNIIIEKVAISRVDVNIATYHAEKAGYLYHHPNYQHGLWSEM